MSAGPLRGRSILHTRHVSGIDMCNGTGVNGFLPPLMSKPLVSSFQERHVEWHRAQSKS